MDRQNRRKRTLKLTTRFRNAVAETDRYIREHSPDNADKFTRGLPERLENVLDNPFAYPREFQIPSDSPKYRFSTYMKSFKIVFKILSDKVVILDLVHVARGSDYYRQLRTTDYT